MSQYDICEAALTLLRQMIAIPSVSRDEARVADVVERALAEALGAAAPGAGPAADGAPRVHRSGNNVWAVAPGYDAGRPTLLLNAHLDTVKPSPSWRHDPFTPTEEAVVNSRGEADVRLYGLGANDDGASLVSLLYVFARLSRRRPGRALLSSRQQPYNLVFLASAEEEVSGRGGVESVLPLLPHVDVALVGEPTGMRAAVAEKGLVVLDGVALGKAGHAARNEGVNAIYVAMEAIDRLRSYAFDRVSPALGPVRVSVTQVNAGTAHNVVPDRCDFVVDVRTTDAYTNEETVALLQQAVPAVTLTPRSTRLQPSRIDAQHPLLQRARSLGCETFGSPTLSDQALLPCPSLKMGPGDSARSHTADEYILHSEVRDAIGLYLELLDGLQLD